MTRSEQKQCYCCTANIKYIDYKNAEFLMRFVTPLGKIGRRRGTNLCAKHQRMIANAIKRARTLGLVPFTTR
jgi:small subunit ribosomal protein S18